MWQLSSVWGSCSSVLGVKAAYNSLLTLLERRCSLQYNGAVGMAVTFLLV